MWDDLTIGKGNQGITAITLLDFDNTHISQNRVSYWITHSFVGAYEFGMVIFKDTKEGIKLKDLVEKEDTDKVANFLDEVILKLTNRKIMKKMIKEIYEAGIQKGKEDKAREFRGALLIEDN
jgi:hypothetical protein